PVVLLLEPDRGRDGEVGGRVARPLPTVSVRERRAVLPVPRDDRGLDRPLCLGPGPEEPGALRRAQPFVAVPRVDVGPERLEVEVDLAGRVGAVDDEERARCAGATGEGGDVVDAPGR